MTVRHDIERRAAGNRRLAKKRVQCLNEVLCFVSNSVLVDSFVLRNRQLLVANRWQQCMKNKIRLTSSRYKSK